MKKKPRTPTHRPAKPVLDSNTPTEISKLIEHGFELHKQVRIQEAAAVYEEILKRQPNHFDALQLLAAVFWQQGNPLKALELFDQALVIDNSVASVHNNRGNALKELNRLDDAIKSYSQAITLKPDYADATFNRGIIFQSLGRLDEALLDFNHALEQRPDYTESYFYRGVTLQKLMRLDDALLNYDKTIKLKPDHPVAHFNRGNVLQALGRLEEAVRSYDLAIILNPDNADAHNNRGHALQLLNRLDEALLSYDRVIALTPNSADVYSNRGNALQGLMRLEEALLSYDKAIALKPDYADAYNNRGNTLQLQKRLSESLLCYDQALVFKPDHADAYYNSGNALKDLKRLNEAVIRYDQAIAIRPNHGNAYNNRGNALQDLKHFDEALMSYDHAIALKPDYAEAHFNRGVTLQELKRFDEALLSYDQAIKLNPDYHFMRLTRLHTQMHLCDWRNFDSELSFLQHEIECSSTPYLPFPLLALTDEPRLHKLASEKYIKDKFPGTQHSVSFPAITPHTKIRIGYFSADFHDHATMHLMAELFECHNKDQFEFIAFSFGPITNDSWQQRAKDSFHQFIDCHRLSDAEVAQLSRELGIHIAVDLKGFTTDSRTGIFAERAAPVQVNFIGYPGTMGADYIDYVIADHTLIPQDSRAFYTEKIAYLPNCYQPNCRSRAVDSNTIKRSDFGLPEHGIVFSSFNNNYKITPAVFASWIRILQAVDRGVLWLLATNSTAEKNLRQYISNSGIDPNRLVFAQKLPIEAHLARIPLADLMLDTFPYGAHTTCSDSLRMGLPVVTMMGQSFASRVAASLLTNVGLSDLISNTQSDYEALAIELANKPQKLAGIRAQLAANVSSSPLFNSERFAADLESLYLSMYQRLFDQSAVNHHSPADQ